MNDVIVSEWLKVRTVRSTYWLVAATVAALLLGCLIAALMVADWDTLPPAERGTFGSADPSVLVLPFVQFCAAVFGALAATSEFGTGMIRPTLVAVPRRLRLFAGKAAVVGGAGLLTGLVIAFLTLGAVGVIVGDRPAPIAPWPTLADGVPHALGNALSVLAVGLVGYGLGTVIRSAAGTLVTMAALLFVLPVVALFLPAPWDLHVASVLLPNLAQLAVEQPAKAVITLACYLTAALGAGAWSLRRRDA